jgi:hypothetical protein
VHVWNVWWICMVANLIISWTRVIFIHRFFSFDFFSGGHLSTYCFKYFEHISVYFFCFSFFFFFYFCIAPCLFSTTNRWERFQQLRAFILSGNLTNIFLYLPPV